MTIQRARAIRFDSPKSQWGPGVSGAKEPRKGHKPRALSPHPACGLHLCRLRRRTWVCGRGICAAAILPHIDAFDSKRSNSRRPARVPDYYGGRGCVDLPDRGQRGHGHRLYASHRNPFTVNELRRIFGAVYVPGAGRGDERPHAPVCKLNVIRPQWSEGKIARHRPLGDRRNGPDRKRKILSIYSIAIDAWHRGTLLSPVANQELRRT